jgi:starch-binding outer membrane protein, SusD/RagB family
VIARIRLRAGITQPDNYLATITTKEQMRDLIRNERRLELCFEGFRFWDIRRWGLPLNETVKGITVNSTGTTFTPMDVETRNYPPSYGTYMPLPFEETLKYGGLIQNEGW